MAHQYHFNTMDSSETTTGSSIIVSPTFDQSFSYQPSAGILINNSSNHRSNNALGGSNSVEQNGMYYSAPTYDDMQAGSYPPKSKKKSLFNKIFSKNHEDQEQEVVVIDSTGQRVKIDTLKRSESSLVVNDMNHDYFVPKKKSNNSLENVNSINISNENLPEEEKEARKLKKKKRQDKLWKELMSMKKTGLFFSIWNLINDVISPGTVSMPQVVASSGLYMSIIWFVLFGVVTAFTLCLVYELSRRHLKTTLPELAMLGFGKIGFFLTCVFIFFFNFGGACAQLLMFGQVVPDLLAYAFDSDSIFLSRRAILIYLAIALLPIALQKRLGSFAFFSFAAVFSVFAVTAIVNYELLFGPKRYIPHDRAEAFEFVHPKFMSSLGNLAYIYICHDMSFHVFQELRRATRLRYYIVVFSTVIMTVVCCTAMGVGGYLIFWERNLKEANVLDLFPKNVTAAIVGRLFLTVSIVFSIPYSAFMPRNSIILVIKVLFGDWYNSKNGILRFWPKKNTNTTESKALLNNNPDLDENGVSKKAKQMKKTVIHYCSTFFVMGLALVIALSVTDLGIVFNITGGISACCMAYILPCLLALKLEPGKFTLLKISSVITLIMGLIIMGSTIYSVIDSLIHK